MKTLDVRKLSVMVVAAFCVLVACQKTPDEPAPRPSLGADTMGTTAAAQTNRCIKPLAAVAPPPAEPAKECPKDPDPPTSLPARQVVFPESGAKVEAEVVRTQEETSRGLMYRTKMAENAGMLFRMRSRDVHEFWMKNTCLPLDMMFIDEDGVIVGIYENVPTLNFETRSVGCPSRYVLEVNQGWSRRHGVKPGHKVQLPD